MGWNHFFETIEKDHNYISLINNLEQLKKEVIIYPPEDKWFNCFKLTPYTNVKVVILGQDPYINEGEANGLAFSTLAKKLPPSLKNMYKSLIQDYDCSPSTGDLSNWAKQGVLLLNTILTVESGKSLSHENIGWEYFTKEVIKYLNNKENVIYLLMGRKAQLYEKYIDTNKHVILKSPHPSPLSFYRGYLESSPFLNCNKYLIKQGERPINWCI